MNILVVNSFGTSPKSLNKYKNYQEVIKQCFARIKLPGLIDDVKYYYRNLNDIDDFLNLDGSNKFQTIDVVLADISEKYLPWTRLGIKLTLLTKLCIQYKKKVFFSNFGLFYLIYYKMSDCLVEINIINSKSQYPTIRELQALPNKIVKNLKYNDYFFDYSNGDLYEYFEETNQWIPKINVGFHNRFVAENDYFTKDNKNTSYAFSKTSYKPASSTTRVSSTMIPTNKYHVFGTEKKCEITRNCRTHWLVKDFRNSFLLEYQTEWISHIMDYKNESLSDFNLLVVNEYGPVLVDIGNFIAGNFKVIKEVSDSVELLNNFINNCVDEIYIKDNGNRNEMIVESKNNNNLQNSVKNANKIISTEEIERKIIKTLSFSDISRILTNKVPFISSYNTNDQNDNLNQSNIEPKQKDEKNTISKSKFRKNNKVKFDLKSKNQILINTINMSNKDFNKEDQSSRRLIKNTIVSNPIIMERYTSKCVVNKSLNNDINNKLYNDLKNNFNRTFLQNNNNHDVKSLIKDDIISKISKLDNNSPSPKPTRTQFKLNTNLTNNIDNDKNKHKHVNLFKKSHKKLSKPSNNNTLNHSNFITNSNSYFIINDTEQYYNKIKDNLNYETHNDSNCDSNNHTNISSNKDETKLREDVSSKGAYKDLKELNKVFDSHAFTHRNILSNSKLKEMKSNQINVKSGFKSSNITRSVKSPVLHNNNSMLLKSKTVKNNNITNKIIDKDCYTNPYERTTFTPNIIALKNQRMNIDFSNDLKSNKNNEDILKHNFDVDTYSSLFPYVNKTQILNTKRIYLTGLTKEDKTYLMEAEKKYDISKYNPIRVAESHLKKLRVESTCKVRENRIIKDNKENKDKKLSKKSSVVSAVNSKPNYSAFKTLKSMNTIKSVK